MRRLRGVAHEILDAVLATVLRGGWGATVSQRIGLQGGIRLHELTLSVRRPPGSPPLCVGFASDFHAGPATHPKQITLACERLSQAHPDVVLLGGDFVSLSTGALENVCAALGSIPAPLGRFAVLGNHDYRRKRATAIAGALEHNGIRVLRNANVRLGPPHDDVWICGLDDVELGTPDACATFRGADGTRLLLMHGPDGVLELHDHRFDIAFCGHTHGGQVSLPWGTPIIVPGGALDRRYNHGIFHLRPDGEGGHLLVSRGVGCSAIPVRLFAWPEVHAVSVQGLLGHASSRHSKGEHR